MSLELSTLAFEKCISISKRIRWDIDRDVIKGRTFDFTQKFLPDSLSLVNQMSFLSEAEKVLMSQVQGRTYANMFGLVERFIGAKMAEMSCDHSLGDQTAMEALVRFVDEELKHQKLFRRLEELTAREMPTGYQFQLDPNNVATFVLGKSTWAVLALICHIEHFTQEHYRLSIEPAANLSRLYRDVFHFHWREESQHALIDELEWRRIDMSLTHGERDQAANELIELISGLDAMLCSQAAADAKYFLSKSRPDPDGNCGKLLFDCVLRAYRHQYIFSGIGTSRFRKLLAELTTSVQLERIDELLAHITYFRS